MKIKTIFRASKYILFHPIKSWRFFTPKTRRRIKKIVAVILIVCLSVPGYLWYEKKYGGEVPEAEAGWWNDAWMYRKAITVSNSSGGALTDFQVKILDNKDLSADITAGKIQADLDDLRFTDINGIVLPYWIEDTTTNSVDVWIKMSNIPTTGATVYFYYGNAQATSEQNGNNVFEFFDDFSGTSLDTGKWTVIGSANNLNFTNGYIDLTVADNTGSVGSIANGIRSSSKYFSTGYSITSRAKDPNAVSNNHISYIGLTTLPACMTFWNCTSKGLLIYQNDTYDFIPDSQDVVRNFIGSNQGTISDWHNYRIDYINGSSAKYYRDDSLKYTNSTDNTIPDSDNLYVSLGGNDYSNVDPHLYYDYVFVKKYASTDPVAGTPATEEKGGAPVASWSFDEGTGTTANDSSSNRNNGTLTNMASSADPNSGWQSEDKCVSGKCLAFDGSNDYTSVNDSSSIKPATSITLSAWIKPSNPLNGYQMILDKQASGGSNGYTLRIDNSTGKILFRTHGTSSTDLIGNTILSASTWYHIAGVYDGSTSKLYINGRLDNTQNNTGTIIYDNSPVSIGRRMDGYYFKGFIDEPKIYSYARTAAQIAKDYNAGLAGMGKSSEGTSASIGGKSNKWLTDGLVGHWKMDEASWNGTSGEVKDASGNGNNGTASGGATTGAGKYGNGGSFDGGNDVLNMPNGISVKNQSKVTFSAWVYPTSLASNRAIWGELINGLNSQRLGLTIRTDGSIDLGGRDTDGGSFTFFARTNTSVISINNWYHITGVYDADTDKHKIYINGADQTSAVIASATFPNTDPYAVPHIGSSDGANDLFVGKIDDVRIYNRALSPKEVSDLYNYAPGPVGYWNMDDATGTTAKDLSGNNNHGTLTNGPTWTTAGKYGGAVSFDGSNKYISLANNYSDLGKQNFSVSGWVKIPSTVATRVGNLFGNYADSPNMNFEVHSSGEVRFYWNNGEIDQHGTKNLKDNSWHYLTYIRNKDVNKIEMFIDGVLEKSVSGAGTDLIFTTPFWIGSDKRSGGLPWNGLIDDVKVYNYARTQKQIVEDMNGGHPAGGSPVGSQLGYWKFDEGNGTTANNSGNGGSTLNGTISGATWSNDGKFGKALSFDGTSGKYVKKSSATMPTGNTPVTISAWIKPNSYSGDRAIACLGTDGVGATAYGIYLNNSKATASFASSNGKVQGTSTIQSGSWYHVVGVYNGTSNKVYVNGVSEGNLTYSSGNLSSGEMSMGAWCNYTASTNFNGLIDEVKIYPYALNDSEVQLDYNQGKSIVLGSKGTESDGKTPSNSSSRAYCPPGNVEGNCAPGLNPAPVGEWRLDDGTGTTAFDTSGNGNNGTLTNGPTWVQGKVGKAVSFGSSQYIGTANDPTSLQITTGTICAWINPTATDYYRGIFSYENDYGAGRYGYSFGIRGGNLAFLIGNSSSYYENYTVSPISTNIWTYTCLAFSPSNIKVYKNGVQVGNYTPTVTAQFYPGNNARIGQIDNVHSYSFSGLIDDVKVYNYFRTPAQIAWDYNRGKPIGWWKFDEGQGGTLYDHSGNGNNGTLTNMDPATDWVTGKNNGALDFDGVNDYVSTSSYVGGYSDKITVSAWIYHNNAGGWNTIVAGGCSDFLFSFYTNQIGFGVQCGSMRYYTGNINSNWHHVTASYDGSLVKIYIDGALMTSSSASWSFVPSPLRFGGDAYTGKIDDVRVYNYVLSDEQVKQIYNNGAVDFK